jgi:hypothetical protein
MQNVVIQNFLPLQRLCGRCLSAAQVNQREGSSQSWIENTNMADRISSL